jgi:hypothetical protein
MIERIRECVRGAASPCVRSPRNRTRQRDGDRRYPEEAMRTFAMKLALLRSRLPIKVKKPPILDQREAPMITTLSAILGVLILCFFSNNDEFECS